MITTEEKLIRARVIIADLYTGIDELVEELSKKRVEYLESLYHLLYLQEIYRDDPGRKDNV